jgi:hypothetical protein
MIYPTLKPKPVPNFPKKLDENRSIRSNSFPNDLVANGRNYYTQIQFVDYSVFQQFNSFGAFAAPAGGINLPIPIKLNENVVQHWQEFSLTNAVLGKLGEGATGAALSVGSIATGLAVNPLMFLQYKRPEFKLYSLSWLLSPRTAQESQTIKNIVTQCKRASAPTNLGFLLGYPQVAMIRIHPNSVFGNLYFKPCVITSVQVDYTPNPTPSFFENGAPTTVALTLNLKEMQYWYRNEIV